MVEDKDLQILALKCPNCGGALRVPEGTDKALCEHCKSTVLIMEEGGQTSVETTEPESPEAAAATRRMVKIVLWIVGIAIVLPVAATVIVNIIIGLVSLLVVITLSVTAK